MKFLNSYSPWLEKEEASLLRVIWKGWRDLWPSLSDVMPIKNLSEGAMASENHSFSLVRFLPLSWCWRALFHTSGTVQCQVGGVWIPVGLCSRGSVANRNARVVLMMLRHSTWPDNEAQKKYALTVLGSL